ncbi:MAG: hypothetical protein PHG87_04845 [Candidatus Omnitrophica bacterium]|nr:hypothetical protein [Candidatus Omnitrophota bacterium]
MRKALVLLCLGLIGCATSAKETPVVPVFSEMEMDKIISTFSETIKNNPNYTGAYYNRAMAYFHKNNYAQCWQDVHKAESLGLKFSANFLASLRKSSGRQE